MLSIRSTLLSLFCLFLLPSAHAADQADALCPRPAEGSVVQEPPTVHSTGGVLSVSLKFRSVADSNGNTRFCYMTDAGQESPLLRLAPGDRLAVHLVNEGGVPTATPVTVPIRAVPQGAAMPAMHDMPGMKAAGAPVSGCRGTMSASATNLHFHGLTIPPTCHQDESIYTLVSPKASFDYSIRMPDDSPPGLYWYHPHPHGYSTAQVQGGASGPLIVEGIQSVVPVLKDLPERTFILRDQLQPAAISAGASSDKPSWDVSLNYVPIRYPKYVPAIIQTPPGERQFWRFVNSAANTIFHLRIEQNGKPQVMTVYAIDGIPVPGDPVDQTSIFLPPGSRAEFTITTPAVGQPMRLLTQKHDPGPAGDSAPARPLADIVAVEGLKSSGPARQTPIHFERASRDLHNLMPSATRMLYFSQNGNGTEDGVGAADKFYLTVVGQPMKLFDMSGTPNIVTHQGTVEDWTLTNMTPEDHIFHIHQVHFQLMMVDGVPVDDPVVRDTILVPHQVGRTPISSITVRMDFRSPELVGTFPYHCHILDHEDKGMMGLLQILPAEKTLKPAGE